MHPGRHRAGRSAESVEAAVSYRPHGAGGRSRVEALKLARPSDAVAKDARLRNVAEIYKAAQPSGKPTQAVSDALFMSQRNAAARLVMEARRSGYLPPADRGGSTKMKKGSAMRGSTRKRGKTWTAYWDLPADPKTGSRRAGEQGRVPDAEGRAAVPEGDATEGRQRHLRRALLGAAQYVHERMAADLEANAEVKPRRHSVPADIQQYVEPREIGTMPLRRLEPSQIVGLYTDLERCSSRHVITMTPSVHRSGCRDPPPDSRRDPAGAQRAVRWEKLARNPAARIRGPRVAETRVTSWTPGECADFLSMSKPIACSHYGGSERRPGCAAGSRLGLQWQTMTSRPHRCAWTAAAPNRWRPDVRPAEVEARPARSRSTLNRAGAPRSPRPATVRAGTSRRRVRARRPGVLQPARRPDLAGAAHRGVLQDWKAARILVGSLHVLRHTSATLALTAGIPLHVVAARLGDDPRTVLATYAHLLPHSDAHGS